VNFLSEPIITKATVLLTDSRFVSQPQHSIFFAIKGERHDGHVFIKELYEKDVREFVVEKNSLSETLKTQLENLADAKIFVVENTIRACEHVV
jgi:alanine racemase